MKQNDFEASLRRIEAIVARLSDSECGLDEMMAIYKEGKKLISDCEERIDKAALQIKILTSGKEAE